MSEEKSNEKEFIAIRKFNKIYCPCCNNQLNLKSKKDVNFKIKEADSGVWCRSCQRWIYFSLD